MKHIRNILLCLLCCICCACHNIDEQPNTVNGNFELLWQLFDEHYCYFDAKGVDWRAVHDDFAPRAENCRTQRELFILCSEMLDCLRDGHVNLISSFDTYSYREWWAGYPQNFNRRVLLENYLYFSYASINGITYAVLPCNVGYIHIPSFSTPIGEGNLDNILASMAGCRALIVDVRDNGGGDLTMAERWGSRFVTERTLAGYVSHKTGPGHNDFSEPYPFYYSPQPLRYVWTKPVAVLTNRSTFSAANTFVGFMRGRENVTLVGDRTGGGSGMPISYELPVGWGVRMSAAPMLDAKGQSTEEGIVPDIRVDITDADIAAGRDAILDRAINFLTAPAQYD